MKKIVVLVLALAFSFSSCEKDDICDANTPTTPRLIITFHDLKTPSVLKNIENLKVIGTGMTQGIIFNPNASGEAKYVTNSSKIGIPLKTTEDTCSFSFILNSGNSNLDLVNTDHIKIDYSRNEVFVSRACGFKTLFTLNTTNPITHTDAATPDQKWIKYISVEKNNIDNENETHLKIFF